MARKRLTRKKVNDPVIDTALRDIYDKLDTMQPEVAGKTSKLAPQIGDTQLVETPSGQTMMSSYTEDGWMIDMNSNYTPTSNLKGFEPALGTHGKSRTPIQGEALKYNRNKNVPISNDKKEKVLLKNVSNELQVRNANDTADATIKAEKFNVSGGTAASVGDITRTPKTDSTVDIVKIVTNQLFIPGSLTGEDVSTSLTILSGADEDAVIALGDATTTNWVMGFDASDNAPAGNSVSGRFKIHATTDGTLPDAADFELDVDGNLTIAGTLTTASGVSFTQEAIEDIVGGMFSGNDETRISATYQDGDGTIDLAVDDMTANTMGSGFTVSATTDSNATTITQGDDLFFAAGTGITCTTTADGTVTIANTVSAPTNYITNDADDTMAGTLTIDKTSSATTTSSNYGQKIDLTHTGNTAGSQTITNYGLDIDLDYTGNNSGGLGSGANTNNFGINIALNADAGTHSIYSGIDNTAIKAVLTGDTSTGTTLQVGCDLTVTGGDVAHQTGILLNTDDGSTDLKIVSSAESADYCAISTSANGATTIETVDYSGIAANLTINLDGGLYIDADSGEARLTDGGGTYTPVHSTSLTTKAYVDTGDVIKTATVTLSESDMNSLSSTAIEIVGAQGANKVIIPTSGMLFIDRDGSTTQSVSGANLFVSWNGSTTTSATIYYIRRFMYNESGDRIWHLQHLTGESGASLTAGDNQPLTVKLNTAITSGSIDSMKVVVSYYVYDNS